MPKRFTYNRPITIQKYTGGTDAAYNQEDRTADGSWSDYFTGFCREIPRGTSEFFRTARLDARIERVLKIRWNDKVLAAKPQDYRVKFEGKTLYLTGIEDESADDRELSLSCTQWVEASNV